MFRIFTALICVCFVLTSTASFAQEVSQDSNEVAELKAMVNQLLNRVDTLEAKLEKYEANEQANTAKVNQVTQSVSEVTKEVAMVKSDLNEVANKPAPIIDVPDDIEIGLGLTSTYMVTYDANQGNDVNDATWSLDLELSKEFDNGSAYMLLEAGQGGGVDEELTTFSNANFDATGGNGNVEMVEAWYEHNVNDLLTVTFGKLDATIYIDTNEYANDEGGQFLGSMFRNNPAIAFADNGFGVRLSLAPYEALDIDVLAMDGDGDFEDILDKGFYASQLNFKPELFDRAGNYRVYGWLSNQSHAKYDDPTGSTDNSNYGFGVSFDQELSDNLGVFVRYGYQNPDVFTDQGAAGFTAGTDFSIGHSYSLGVQLSGALWDRGDDAFGIAWGQNIPSGEYEDQATIEAKKEGHFEAYYNYVVNDHLTISPIVHVIANPFGDDAAGSKDTIIIGGVRSQVDF